MVIIPKLQGGYLKVHYPVFKNLAVTVATLAVLGTNVFAASIPAIPVNKPEWFARHEGFLQQGRTSKIDLLFFGDSITDFWRGDGNYIWKKTFIPMGAADFGIGGDKVENVLWRVRNGELDQINPRVVVLLIGTNNLTTNTVDEITATQAELVAEIRQRSPATKILLFGIFPRATRWSAEFNKNIAPINLILSQLDEGRFIRFMDIGEKFKSPYGEISQKIMYDGLHLTEKGYQIWTDAMLPTLLELRKSK